LVWIDDAEVFPDVAARSVRIKLAIGNTTGKAGSGTVTVGSVTSPVTWEAKGGAAELEVPLAPDAQTWSEFNPALQHLTVQLAAPGIADQRDLSFGLRQIKADGKQMLLNGTPIEIRATHDGGGFPLTGYPPTDVESWKRIISVCKTWGRRRRLSRPRMISGSTSNPNAECGTASIPAARCSACSTMRPPACCGPTAIILRSSC
jgi:hypothetical protein